MGETAKAERRGGGFRRDGDFLFQGMRIHFGIDGGASLHSNWHFCFLFLVLFHFFLVYFVYVRILFVIAFLKGVLHGFGLFFFLFLFFFLLLVFLAERCPLFDNTRQRMRPVLCRRENDQRITKEDCATGGRQFRFVFRSFFPFFVSQHGPHLFFLFILVNDFGGLFLFHVVLKTLHGEGSILCKREIRLSELSLCAKKNRRNGHGV